jgi:hypothetical protein
MLWLMPVDKDQGLAASAPRKIRVRPELLPSFQKPSETSPTLQMCREGIELGQRDLTDKGSSNERVALWLRDGGSVEVG